jgi:hypothetical protein
LENEVPKLESKRCSKKTEVEVSNIDEKGIEERSRISRSIR